VEKEFEKVHAKLDKITEDMTDVKVAQARIEVSQDLTKVIMDEHIKRTALAEENIELLRQELKPVKKHVQLINNLFKFIIAFGSLLLFLNEMDWLGKIAALLF
jgi:deoxyribose-phosphate aldolase